jgi:membrane-associated HD superfamily phosphohydrolase
MLLESGRFNRLVGTRLTIVDLHGMRLGIVAVTILILGVDHFVRGQMRHRHDIILTIATLVKALLILMMHQMGFLELRDVIRLVGTHLTRVNLLFGLDLVQGLIRVGMLKHLVMLDPQ